MAGVMAIGIANWPAVALAVLLVLLAGWWLVSRRGGAARERHRAPDALDAGVAPARRNQALIDSPSAAADLAAARVAAPLAGTGPDIFGGIGEVVAVAAASEVVAAHHAGVAAQVAPAHDDLTRLKGVGPKLSARLAELGVTSFAQIAGWSEGDIAAVDAQLGSFAGRATRDNWVEQARFLAVGDVAGYEARFGKL